MASEPSETMFVERSLVRPLRRALPGASVKMAFRGERLSAVAPLAR